MGRTSFVGRLFQQADVISLHVPQFPDTERMIDARALSQMKRMLS